MCMYVSLSPILPETKSSPSVEGEPSRKTPPLSLSLSLEQVPLHC